MKNALDTEPASQSLLLFRDFHQALEPWNGFGCHLSIPPQKLLSFLIEKKSGKLGFGCHRERFLRYSDHSKALLHALHALLCLGMAVGKFGAHCIDLCYSISCLIIIAILKKDIILSVIPLADTFIKFHFIQLA